MKTIQIENDTHHKIKLQSFKEDKTMKELINEMINERKKKK